MQPGVDSAGDRLGDRLGEAVTGITIQHIRDGRIAEEEWETPDTPTHAADRTSPWPKQTVKRTVPPRSPAIASQAGAGGNEDRS